MNPKVKARLDKVFSEYIRLRDANNGIVKCISCGKFVPWKDSDCGHFINRGHMSTRYDEQNCNAQCRLCNRFDEGNFIGYQRGLIAKYGEGIIEKLEIRKHNINKITDSLAEILIKQYKQQVTELKKRKI